ncbi:MAG TPA: hypothetical protein VGE22_18800 [Solimonas sp.]|jgi:hypothetical protein
MGLNLREELLVRDGRNRDGRTTCKRSQPVSARLRALSLIAISMLASVAYGQANYPGGIAERDEAILRQLQNGPVVQYKRQQAAGGRLGYSPGIAERDERNLRHMESDPVAQQKRQLAQQEQQGRGSQQSNIVNVGDRICRNGTLRFTACMNPQFPSSCYEGTTPGQIKAYFERGSPDGKRVLVRVAAHAYASGQPPPMLAAYPSLGGISTAPNTMAWDELVNWGQCDF